MNVIHFWTIYGFQPQKGLYIEPTHVRSWNDGKTGYPSNLEPLAELYIFLRENVRNRENENASGRLALRQPGRRKNETSLARIPICAKSTFRK